MKIFSIQVIAVYNLFMNAMTNLKLVSYNIWFENILIDERLNSLIKVLRDNDVDIICLQEVRKDVYEKLKNELGEYPYCIPKTMDQSYGCTIMSRHKIQKFKEFSFPKTKMGRSLLVIKLNIDGKDVIVGNTHFESTFTDNNREKINQFKISENILDSMYDKYGNAIICTDSNVMNHEESLFFKGKNSNGENVWTDAWTIKGDNSDKYTYDGSLNRYLILRNIKYRCRLDRILFRSNDMELLRYSMLRATGDEIEPSDHFGVLTEFSVV